VRGIWAGLLIGVLASVALRRRLRRARAAPAAVAHRGGAATAPESTLAAYRGALAAGIPNWELDVQLSSDGALMVFHDETLDRTTDGHGPLGARTCAALQTLDAGGWFGAAWRGERIPTLAEVIALARTRPGCPARLVIEIKSPHLYPGIEQALLTALTAADFAGQVLIMSFDGASLERVRALAPHLPLVHLRGENSRWSRRPAAQAEMIGPRWQMLALQPWAIPRAHRAGRQVYTWTVNSLLGLRWLRLWGVDGIISDRLDLLRQI